MDNDLAFVKEQIAVQERLAAKFADQPHRAGLHLSTANRQKALYERLQRLLAADSLNAVSDTKRVNVSLADLDGLPDDLMSELSISDVDRQEMVIEDIIANNAGVISLDKLIICYYKRQNEILKRSALVNRLFRMVEKGMIFNVPGKRGYYSVFKMNDEDVNRTFGQPVGGSDEASHSSSTLEVQDIGREAEQPVPPPRIRRRFLGAAPAPLMNPLD